MAKFIDIEREKQTELIKNSDLFDNARGGGIYKGKEREFVLKDANRNLYKNIIEDSIKYFKENNISWWGGSSPTGHVLSSQIACLNHLFLISNDKDAVLNILNNVRNEFIDVLPIPCDKPPYRYISFEVVSSKDRLNEKQSTRGSQCTSIDAFIYAKHKDGKLWLIPIEWKYTENYENNDKSKEDIAGVENKGLNGKGNERLNRYSNLIDNSKQLKRLDDYMTSIYFQEPFYQLMRQTLWTEQIIINKEDEVIKADDYFHLHVIPRKNVDLLGKIYKVSGNNMENTWRGQLEDNRKYIIIDPKDFLSPLEGIEKYSELISYLNQRYW